MHTLKEFAAVLCTMKFTFHFLSSASPGTAWPLHLKFASYDNDVRGLYVVPMVNKLFTIPVFDSHAWPSNSFLWLSHIITRVGLSSLTVHGWLMLMWLLNFVEGFDFITVSSASCYISLHTLYPPQHIENSILAISITGALWSTATTTTGIPLPSGK